MMTSQDPAERRAAMAARVHRLSDPLAAMGQRSAGQRVQRERNARMALLVITLSATLAITGAIATVADQPSANDSTVASQPFPGRQVETVHVRTKSS